LRFNRGDVVSECAVRAMDKKCKFVHSIHHIIT
jgi:hypothetical protein